jgi:hypothetical protein
MFTTTSLAADPTGFAKLSPQAKQLALAASRRKRRFLDAFAESGLVYHACERARISHGTVCTWRREDPEFNLLYQEHLDAAIETFAKEAVRRGRDGWLEPVYQGGKKVGSIRKYSDRLLELVLKAKLPEYRQASVKHEHSGPAGGPIVVTNVIEGYSDAELAEVNRMLESKGIKVLPDVIDVTPK